MLRPPPEVAEYHEENPLYGRVLDRLAAEPDVQTIVIPRTQRQADAIRQRGTTNEERGTSFVVPDRAVDAQSLIAFADIVISAGGTMNREAVALGTPVYTTFAGRMGGVDERLISEGRLRVLSDAAEIELRRRDSPPGVQHPRDPSLLVEGVLGAE